ncbi:MAG TPA: DUF4258 domain-containing protein [Chthoniobacteraceae bacterium]|jgi:hypothetical protein|nr:DUF4258 domain-containing protein [Chthoniobacteraceae bacterium]
MAGKPLVFRVHAIERMAQRGIGVEEVRHVLDTGEVIEDYPTDFPYPSALMLGWIGERPLHVVAATTPDTRIIITVYEPDPSRWEPDFKKRKP